MRRVPVIQILIGGPSDTEGTRSAIKTLIEKWNATHGTAMGIAVLPVLWKTHSAPLMGDDPQSIINRQMVKDCDGMIAVFHWRIGSQTPHARSGTVEEIEYFRTVTPPRPVSILFRERRGDEPADAQAADVATYEVECRQDGLLGTFDDHDELRDVIERIVPEQVRMIRESNPESTEPAVENISVQQRRVGAPPLPEVPVARDGFELLEMGKLDEGIAVLREYWKAKPEGRTWESTLAVGLAYATIVGESEEAFDRLSELYSGLTHKSVDLAFTFAQTLFRRGRQDEALAELEPFVGVKGKVELRCLSLFLEIKCLLKETRNAFAVFRRAYAQAREPRQRGAALREFARVLDDTGYSPRAIELLELAQDIQKGDAEGRSLLAGMYYERDSDSPMPLLHYEELREGDDDATHVTNVAWYEDRAGFPIAAMGRYKEAAARGEPYAIANLAQSYLKAGFVEEARGVLRNAVVRNISHPQIEKALGAIAHSEEEENTERAEFVSRLKRTNQLQIERAKAQLQQPIDWGDVSGYYSGEPSYTHLTLACEPDGSFAGSFHYQFGISATITGTIEGRLLTFTWEADQPRITPIQRAMIAQTSLFGNPRDSGSAELILTDGFELSGYWIEGSGSVTVKNVESVVSCKLKKGTEPIPPSVTAVLPIAVSRVLRNSIFHGLLSADHPYDS